MDTITNLQLSNSYKITLSRKCINANLFYQWSYNLNLHWQRLSEIRLKAVSTRLLVIYFEQYFITTSTRNIGFLIYWISGEVLEKVPLFRIGTPPYYWVSYTIVTCLLYRVHFFTISSALFCTIGLAYNYTACIPRWRHGNGCFNVEHAWCVCRVYTQNFIRKNMILFIYNLKS